MPRGYVRSFDGLRGVAVLLVIAHHSGYLNGGWVGVSLFFALSGYLITGLLVGEHATTGKIERRAFYMRRVGRLLPGLVAALVGLAIALRMIGVGRHTIAVGTLVTVFYAMNLVKVVAPSSPAVGYYAWAWTLSLEEQFYFLWPTTLRWLLRRMTPRRIAEYLVLASVLIMLARVVVGHRDPISAYFIVRGDELLLGCVAGLLVMRPRWWMAPVAVAGISAIAVVSLDAWSASIGLTVASIASVAGVVAVSRDTGWLARILSSRPLVHVGRISYALYLWNCLLNVPIAGLHSKMPAGTLAEWLVLTLVLAEASTWLLERPAQRWIRKRYARRTLRLGQSRADVLA